jgi:hypothetical protein
MHMGGPGQGKLTFRWQEVLQDTRITSKDEAARDSEQLKESSQLSSCYGVVGITCAERLSPSSASLGEHPGSRLRIMGVS